jgi:DNA polymerase III subunit beta
MQHQAIDQVSAEPMRASFMIDRAALLRPLGILTKRIIEHRNTIPILANVAMLLTGNVLRIMGTNLDQQLSAELDCAGESDGAFTVSAHTLFDLIKRAKTGALVSFVHDGERVTINSGRATNTLPTLPIDNFPVLQAPIGGNQFTLSAEYARDLRAVSPAISKNESRYYLNGVHLEASAGRMFIVATDGHNLGCVDRAAPIGIEGMADSIIPRQAIAALLYATGKTPAPLSVHLDARKVQFDIEGMTITSKLIDGTFPDWRRLLNNEIGDELSEGHIPRHAIAKLEKGADTPLSVDFAGAVCVLTSPDYPEFFGLSMAVEGADKNATIASDEPSFDYVAPAGQARSLWEISKGNLFNPVRGDAARKATDAEFYAYARDYAERCGIHCSDLELSGYYDGGPCTKALFGERLSSGNVEKVERLNWETLATEIDEIYTPAQYEPGSFSILLPGYRQAPVTISVDGEAPVIVHDDGSRKGCLASLTAIMGPDIKDRARKVKPVKAVRQSPPIAEIEAAAPPSVECEAEISPVDAPHPESGTLEPETPATQREAYQGQAEAPINVPRETMPAVDRELADWQAFMMARFGEMEARLVRVENDAIQPIVSKQVAFEGESGPSTIQPDLIVAPIAAMPDTPPIGAKERSPAHVRAIMAYLRARRERRVALIKCEMLTVQQHNARTSATNFLREMNRAGDSEHVMLQKRRRAVIRLRDMQRRLNAEQRNTAKSKDRLRNVELNFEAAQSEISKAERQRDQWRDAATKAETALAAVQARANGWPPAVSRVTFQRAA